MAELRIGCSGFNYLDWRGKFYPESLPEHDWLRFYSELFDTVELNVTFYRLPREETFRRWRQVTPAGFRFSVKGSRFITHVRRLQDPEEPLARFFDAAFRLEEKLDAVLWQFPLGFGCDAARLERFLELLANYEVRHALEFRNESWRTREIASLCRDHGVALCMADWPEFAEETPLTADFAYLRRHGRHGDHASCYSGEELRADARRAVGLLARSFDVYVYFNNDGNACAPSNARDLAERLGVEPRREEYPYATLQEA